MKKSIIRAALASALAALSLAGGAGLAHAEAPGGLGDGDGDGIADVWVTSAHDRYAHSDVNGVTRFYKGAVSHFSNGPSIGIANTKVMGTMGLADASALVALPDVTGDKRADLMGRVGDNLFLYKNNGDGSVTRSTQIGHGWAPFDNIIYAGHLNGDADQYLLARRTTDESLWAYKFTASGTLIGMGQAGQHWGAIKTMLAPGQILGDAKDDLMAIDTSGHLNCYRGAGLGKLYGTGVCGSGWNAFKYVFVAGDMDQDGKYDIVAIKASTHPSRSCDSQGNCDPIEKLCTNAPSKELYPSEYEVAASTDQCRKQGDAYRLKPENRGPMYVYRNLGQGKWATPAERACGQ